MAPIISVVIPVLNESGIAAFTAAIADVLRPARYEHEILLVNDGEPVPVEDGQFSANGVRVVEGTHGGKGLAVRDGILAARGDVIVVMDADLVGLIPRLPQFIDLVTGDGYDVVIAERDFDFHARKAARLVLSLALLLAQRLFVFQSLRFFDTQCGMKAFRGDAARAIAAKQRVGGGMYDIEYLYAALQNRMRIAQIPVGRIKELRPSRIRLLRCLRTDPAALIGVKWRGLRGHYRLPKP